MSSLRRIFALCSAGIALLVVMLQPVSAAAKNVAVPAPQKVATVEGITEYRLHNGLRVLLFPDPSKPTITVNVTYLVGSRHESYGETGMAHLLEHLMFKGTPKNPDIDKEFNRRGMRFNGTTAFDRTNYYELFDATEDNLAYALQMEADRMVNSFIAKKDLDSEMTVVRNEYESGENRPFGVLLKRLQSVAYDWHNYGHSTIGNRSDIENVAIENLQAFYRRYYQPDNAVLLVAGRFDADKTLQLINRDFGVIAKPTRVLPTLWTVEPTQDGERAFYVRRSGDFQIVAVAYHVPSERNADASALEYAVAILSDAPSGRLHKALVETGKAAQVTGFGLTGVDSGLLIVGAVVKKDEPIDPVREELVKVTESLATNPPSEEEMERVRQAFANRYERALTNHEQIGLELSEYIALGDWRLFFAARDRDELTTREAVQAAAAKYLRRDNRTVGYFVPEEAPQRADIPPPITVTAALADFKPKQTQEAAEAFDSGQDNIDKRTKHIEIGGLKVALLAKKNRGATVSVSLRLRTGDEKTLFNQRTIAQLTGEMLTRGTTRYTRTQLKDEMEKLKMEGNIDGLSSEFETTGPNLPAAIRLAAHMLREPSFPEAEFEQLQNLIETALEGQRNDPNTAAGYALGEHFNIYPKGDWRYVPTLDENLASIRNAKLADIRAFHDKFYGANRGELAIVGDFDEDAAVRAITDAFAGWKTEAPYARITDEYRQIAPVNRAIETPDKENATFRARINVDMDEADADYPALYLANYILGGGAGFDSRLTARIRVKEGLSYGVNSSLKVGQIDRAGAWQVQAIAAPQNIAKVEAAFKDELAKALRDGFTAAEVAAAKSGAIQRRAQARAQDGRLADEWTKNLYLDRTFVWSKDFETKLVALQPADLLAALRKHIDPAKITIIKAGDFANKARVD